ncbi:SPW repeat protein [Natronolimnobius baerhuensis]|uniref:SPW repeat-containing integral membrane domain-containing protein n=1 Tax=Natronolimnobius baerhuensis TaxID=253108 RepID=A0A202EC14_9EURY|nr:hypothetical protein [Natronolimnobius baerhuensis]OVE85757.1 hypothetical protein B2G88_02770 [Natronolimnobius baerhuensis]
MSDPTDDRHRETESDSDPRHDERADTPRDPAEEAMVSDVDSETGVGDNPQMDERDPGDDGTLIASEERRRNTSLVSALVAVLGAWVALSVLLYEVSGATLGNNVLVGAVVFVAAGYNYYRLANDIPLSVGVASLVAVLGIWLIISAALFEMIGGMFWSTLVTGLLIAGLSGYNAYEAREARAITDADLDSG